MSNLMTVALVALWVVVIFHILLTLAILRRVLAGPVRRIETLRRGEPAPDFSGETLEGTVVSLQAYRGRDLLLAFMSPSCSNCRISLAQLQELRPALGAAGTECLIVCRAGLAEARSWARELAVEIPVLVDARKESSVTQTYKSPGTPSYCLVGSDGKVRAAGFMAPDIVDWSELTQQWSALAFQRPAAAG